MESSIEFNDGQLSGTAVVPEDAFGGLGRIQVCVLDTGADDVEGPEDTVCSEDSFTVTPLILLTPEAGIPGSQIALDGVGFPSTATAPRMGGPMAPRANDRSRHSRHGWDPEYNRHGADRRA